MNRFAEKDAGRIKMIRLNSTGTTRKLIQFHNVNRTQTIDMRRLCRLPPSPQRSPLCEGCGPIELVLSAALLVRKSAGKGVK
jgi:hypothetical protein